MIFRFSFISCCSIWVPFIHFPAYLLWLEPPVWCWEQTWREQTSLLCSCLWREISSSSPWSDVSCGLGFFLDAHYQEGHSLIFLLFGCYLKINHERLLDFSQSVSFIYIGEEKVFLGPPRVADRVWKLNQQRQVNGRIAYSYISCMFYVMR